MAVSPVPLIRACYLYHKGALPVAQDILAVASCYCQPQAHPCRAVPSKVAAVVVQQSLPGLQAAAEQLPVHALDQLTADKQLPVWLLLRL